MTPALLVALLVILPHAEGGSSAPQGLMTEQPTAPPASTKSREDRLMDFRRRAWRYTPVSMTPRPFAPKGGTPVFYGLVTDGEDQEISLSALASATDGEASRSFAVAATKARVQRGLLVLTATTFFAPPTAWLAMWAVVGVVGATVALAGSRNVLGALTALGVSAVVGVLGAVVVVFAAALATSVVCSPVSLAVSWLVPAPSHETYVAVVQQHNVELARSLELDPEELDSQYFPQGRPLPGS
ncbi:MAG: hypothetical protein AB2A00_31310 [Myxococcota bacterium]